MNIPNETVVAVSLGCGVSNILIGGIFLDDLLWAGSGGGVRARPGGPFCPCGGSGMFAGFAPVVRGRPLGFLAAVRGAVAGRAGPGPVRVGRIGGIGRRSWPFGWRDGARSAAQPPGEQDGGQQEQGAGDGEPVPYVWAGGQGG